MAQANIYTAQACAPAKRRQTGLLSLIGLWRSRRDLSQLDDAALSDVGISAREAAQEAARAPWDVPAHWRN